MYEFGKKSAKLMTEIFATGKFKPSPRKVFPNGLASVQDGFKYMKEGKVRVIVGRDYGSTNNIRLISGFCRKDHIHNFGYA